jgi:hypothetical protein
VKDPVNAAFGFGRRVCPGRHFALASIWWFSFFHPRLVEINVCRANVVTILSIFDISMSVDNQGRLVVPSCEVTSGLTSYVHVQTVIDAILIFSDILSNSLVSSNHGPSIMNLW